MLRFINCCFAGFDNAHTIYVFLVRSQLDYAIIIWYFNTENINHSLESIQNTFLFFLSYKCILK